MKYCDYSHREGILVTPQLPVLNWYSNKELNGNNLIHHMQDNGYHYWIQNKNAKNKATALTTHSANISAISQELSKPKYIVLLSDSYLPYLH